MKNRMIKKIPQILKWIGIIILALIIFCYAKESAYIQRGYSAVGGEYLLLLLPLAWYLTENNIKETKKARKHLQKNKEQEKEDFNC